MSKKVHIQHLSTLYKESDDIKEEFTSLVFHLQEDLESNSKLEKVVSLLVVHKIPEDELCGCATITSVITRIGKFYSFFDYQLIKILVKHLGSTESKKNYEKYESDFQEFAKHRVYECPSDLFDEGEAADGNPGKIYAIKIDKNMKELSLEDLDKLLCKMFEILGHNFAKVVKIEKGCVQVTIRTFSSSDFVISDEQKRALSSLGVVTISCGSESVHIPTVSSPNKSGSGKSNIYWVVLFHRSC